MIAMRVFVRQPLMPWRSVSCWSALLQNAEAATAAVENTSITIPAPSNIDKPLLPKIEKLVREISELNLLEVSELSGALKKRLNLPDAPIMPMGGFMPAAAPADDDEDAAPKAVKTVFNVKLMKYDEKQKVPLIKEIKALVEGMNLVSAKKFVEGAPQLVKADISKEEADTIKAAIEKVGGVVQID